MQVGGYEQLDHYAVGVSELICKQNEMRVELFRYVELTTDLFIL